ncbi:MAG: cellulase family glycosylhydrolase [Anaerolineaceae bacterium]|nr:cellulase family glycosylhydrolase [Anaerolineaceae bacterium]
MKRPFPNLHFHNGSRLLLLITLIWLIQPAPLLIVPGPTQTVHTSRPIVGVHTRLTDEVEEWKIQRSLEMVRQMGAPWIVELFPWAYYHAADGGIAWDHPDMVIEHAHAQGLQVIARIGLTPGWARPPDTPLNYLDATAYDDFAEFAARFAERYQGKLAAIIVGNEPNLSFEWGYREGTAVDYTNLLKTVYPAVKAANPDVLVLGGALAPTLEPAGSPWGLNDLEYLDQMYVAGAADYFDGLAVHTYGLTFPALAEPAPDILNFRRVELVREVMLRHNDADTQIYITEFGWNDHPRWTMAVRPGQRIQNTLDAFTYAEENWPYVEMIAIWAFRFPAPTKSYMDNFTLVTPEFVTKPIYTELQEFTGNE